MAAASMASREAAAVGAGDQGGGRICCAVGVVSVMLPPRSRISVVCTSTSILVSRSCVLVLLYPCLFIYIGAAHFPVTVRVSVAVIG
jgi:hypothetical protein